MSREWSKRRLERERVEANQRLDAVTRKRNIYSGAIDFVVSEFSRMAAENKNPSPSYWVKYFYDVRKMP